MFHQIRSSKVISYPHRRRGARMALSGVCLVTLLNAMGVARAATVYVTASDVNDPGTLYVRAAACSSRLLPSTVSDMSH
jgi:hypothetical protein